MNLAAFISGLCMGVGIMGGLAFPNHVWPILIVPGLIAGVVSVILENQ
jgi:hypothetical protein